MIPPAIPPDETERLQKLEDLYILDTPAEERFDRITRLAVKLFNTPIALISLVDGKRQWFKSCQGLTVSETNREVSFCGHAILSPDPMVVPDAKKDQRFHDNPLVTGEPHIQFYAGYPLVGPQGYRLGVLCVIDHQPREFNEGDFQTLRDLASLAEAELGAEHIHQIHKRILRDREKLRNQAMVDPLTRLWNGPAVLEILELERDRSSKSGSPLGFILANLDGFKMINENYGPPVGDMVLIETARRIRDCLRPTDTAGRIGGDEFLLVLPGVGLPLATEIAERIRTAIEGASMVTPQGVLSVTISLSAGVVPAGLEAPADLVLSQAGMSLREAKQDGRNRVRQCTLE